MQGRFMMWLIHEGACDYADEPVPEEQCGGRWMRP